MKRAIEWIWRRGIVSTFLSGLFAVLPIVLTIAIMMWVAGYLKALLGPDSSVGKALESIGLQFTFVTNQTVAAVIGWVLVLVGIWALGLFIKSVAKHRVELAVNTVVGYIPVVKSVHGTVTQLVGMLRKDEKTELTAMSAVFCSFGKEHGGGFLGLLTSPDTYRFDGRDYNVIYIPTSPIPMSGGLLFVPAETVTKVDMTPDQVMEMYLSLGILASKVIPDRHRVSQDRLST